MRAITVSTKYKSKKHKNAKGEPKVYTSGERPLEVSESMKDGIKKRGSDSGFWAWVQKMEKNEFATLLRNKLAAKVDGKKMPAASDDVEYVDLDS